MQGNCDVEKALLSFYNASFGGKYELASYTQNLDALVQNGYVQVAKCCNDPLATHKSKSCKVPLARITEQGITQASKIVNHCFAAWHTDNEDVILVFLKSIKELPPRVAGLYRFLLKTWLDACENRKEFSWNFAAGVRLFPLPTAVTQSIERMNEALVKEGLAAYASLDHKTSGSSQPTLMTCPEIRDLLLNDLNLKKAILDEYLNYMFNGMHLFHAKDWLLHLLSTRQNACPEGGMIGEEALWSWLRKLESCGYVKILPRTGASTENIEVRSKYYRLYMKESLSIEKISEDVKAKLDNWFATGEEAFQRFEIEIASV